MEVCHKIFTFGKSERLESFRAVIYDKKNMRVFPHGGKKMNEGYVECLVKGKPNYLAKIGKIVLIILTVLLFLASLITGGFWVMILAVLAGVGAYLVSMFTDVEYEYLYLDKEITVDKVFNQSRRKRAAVFSLDKVEVFAPIHSYNLEKFGKKQDHPVDYSIGYEEKPDLRYIMYYEGGKQILFSPNEAMVKAMKNAAPRKVFTD
jgi:hypothetical protein